MCLRGVGARGGMGGMYVSKKKNVQTDFFYYYSVFPRGGGVVNLLCVYQTIEFVDKELMATTITNDVHELEEISWSRIFDHVFRTGQLA